MDPDNIMIVMLHPLWQSFQTSPPTLRFLTETMVAALAAATLAHITFYHYSNQYRSMWRKAWKKPGFISPERVGRVMSGPDSSHPSTRNMSPPFIFSSSSHSPDNESHTPGQEQQQHKPQSATPSMSAPLSAQEQHQQLQHKEDLNGLGIENLPGRLRLDRLTTNTPDVEVIPKETLDIIKSHPGYRIWHLIVVGGAECIFMWRVAQR
ncbi:hypothetical protein EDD21DRAFT_375541 [Dissophora ornata]|nr:hypothetical protein EDD21DRAFT_375541 [Dissophora ornata]